VLLQNPPLTDFQQYYKQIVAEYNREKDRVAIEKAFEVLFALVLALGDEVYHHVFRINLAVPSQIMKQGEYKPQYFD
jgi:hypothetical protein